MSRLERFIFLEEAFKERLQKTILKTSLKRYGSFQTHHLTYSKDLERLTDNTGLQSDYVVECVDYVTGELLRIEFRDVHTFSESSFYLTDPEKDKEIMIERLKSSKEKYPLRVQQVSELSSEALYIECKRCLPAYTDMDDDTLRDLLLEFKNGEAAVEKADFLMWYYKKYFDIDVKADDALPQLKNVWVNSMNTHKQDALVYLQAEKESVEDNTEKEAINDILLLIEELDVESEVDKHEDAPTLTIYWPSILLPAPRHVRDPAIPLFDVYA